MKVGSAIMRYLIIIYESRYIMNRLELLIKRNKEMATSINRFRYVCNHTAQGADINECILRTCTILLIELTTYIYNVQWIKTTITSNFGGKWVMIMTRWKYDNILILTS